MTKSGDQIALLWIIQTKTWNEYILKWVT